jgi:hypothetical protein
VENGTGSAGSTGTESAGGGIFGAFNRLRQSLCDSNDKEGKGNTDTNGKEGKGNTDTNGKESAAVAGSQSDKEKNEANGKSDGNGASKPASGRESTG